MQGELRTKRYGRWLLGLLILTAAAIQLWVAVEQFAVPWQAQLVGLWRQPAWKRAGYVAQYLGPDRTEFIGFLRSSIPQDAKVVIPPEGYGDIFGFPNLMQAYLFPRDIVDCPSDKPYRCIFDLAAAVPRVPVAVIKVAPFPTEDLGVQGFTLHRYNDEWGVFVSEGRSQ